MSIFTDDKIKEDKIYVRFYHWEDPYKGWGDIGTKLYTELPLEDFEVEERENIDNEPYYVYHLKKERGIELLGDYWWMECGYEQSSKEKHRKEVEEIEEELKQVKQNL